MNLHARFVGSHRARAIRALVVVVGSLALPLVGCTADPDALGDDTEPLESLAPGAPHWVAPLATDALHANTPVDVTVYTQRADAPVVHFAVDGAEVGACDPSDPEQDCFDGDHWTWSLAFDTPGAHTLRASFTDAAGATVAIERSVDVADDDDSASAASTGPGGDPSGPDPATEGSAQIAQGVDAARGYIAPDEPMGTAACHRRNARTCDPSSAPGCQAWAVRGGRVTLPPPETLDGSTTEIDRCMEDYGAAIRRYADLRHVSRASVAAWLAASGNCDPCIHWNRGLLSASRCVATARTLQMRLDARTCVARMNADGHDFAVQLAAEYLWRTRSQHHHDPVLEAAIIDHGAHPQRGDINNWCVGAGSSSGAFITHFVAAYNAYRAWESQAHADPRGADTHLCVGYTGWNDARNLSTPQYTELWTRTSGLTNPAICHAYPRYDVATLPASEPDRRYFETWVAAARAAHCEISLALKAPNQQYTPGIACHECAPGDTRAGVTCGSNHCWDDGQTTCGESGRCEAHHVPTPDQYERAFEALRREYPDIHVFSTWNEPNNNGGLESALEPATAAEFYLRARRHCRPRDRCYLAAGDLASWYIADPATHAATVDWWAAGAMQCGDHDPDHLCCDERPGRRCARGSYLDQFKYWIDRLSSQFGLGPHFRPEFFGFHPWRDVQAYANNGERCGTSSHCMTRAFVENLGGSWSRAQLWATEAGLPRRAVAGRDADFGQACEASYLIHLLASYPRITRFYLGLPGRGEDNVERVLRDRLEDFSPACW